MNTQVNLTDLATGESGRIIKLNGGHKFILKLQAMGILEGVIIRKICCQPGSGPITITVGSTQIALGYGMAQKIIIEEISEKDTSGGKS